MNTNAFEENSKNYLKMLQLTLANGKNINQQSYVNSMMILACILGCVKTVEMLIKAGADINFKSPITGDTPLITAVRSRNNEVVQCITKAGANPNLKNKLRQTALHVAAEFDQVNIVKSLICAGANIFSKNYSGKTSVDVAIDNSSLESMQILAEKHHVEVLCSLINAGLDKSWFESQHALAVSIVNTRNHLSKSNVIKILDENNPCVPSCNLSSNSAWSLIHSIRLQKLDTISCIYAIK